jgi:phenylacetaldehyde dehydrogenase
MPTDAAAPTLPDALGDAARAFVAGPHRLLIGAERPEAADGRTFATLDPATGREIAQVPQAGPADVAGALAAARAAFADGPWASMPASGRERVMLALAQRSSPSTTASP